MPDFTPFRRCGQNWFIGRALNRNPNAFSAGEEGFHELAAGLFMVGYDLRDA